MTQPRSKNVDSKVPDIAQPSCINALSTQDNTPVHTSNPSREADRVGIFIDGANLFYAAAHLGMRKPSRRPRLYEAMLTRLGGQVAVAPKDDHDRIAT